MNAQQRPRKMLYKSAVNHDDTSDVAYSVRFTMRKRPNLTSPLQRTQAAGDELQRVRVVRERGGDLKNTESVQPPEELLFKLVCPPTTRAPSRLPTY